MIHSIALLGSTGSIGTQTIEVARHLGIRVSALAAGSNYRLMEEQVRALRPSFCAMGDLSAARELRARIRDTGVKVFAGVEGICDMIGALSCDLLLNATVGGVGLLPTLATVERGIPLALANKESLVCGGELVNERLREKGGILLPVDSEHSAIFQCLQGGSKREVKKLLLTASGGPFFGRKKDDVAHLTAREALRHPTWSMGAKITVDSATMMNKGFEVIEAMHLFRVPAEKIEVLVHRESVVHSLVEFRDGCILAELSVPDMRECIQYALTYPERRQSLTAELDLAEVGCLHFARPDGETFPLLPLARKAAAAGGTVPAAMNAANEAAVAAFLGEKIDFGRLCGVVCEVTGQFLKKAAASKAGGRAGTGNGARAVPSLSEILDAQNEATALASELLAKKGA